MASLGKPQHGNESNLNQQGAITRFFKIILHSTIRDKKLMIPRKFISSYGSKVWRSATLQVPVGEDKWEVELVTDDKKGVWFCNDGWQRFAEFHSLKYGHFLFFEYKGDSTFSIVICDTTATEIQYPVTTKANEAAAQPPKVKEEDYVSKEEDKSPIVSPTDDAKGKCPMVVPPTDGVAQVSQMKRQRCNLIWEWNPCSAVKHESKVVSNLGENDASAGKPKSCWKRELIPVAKEEEFTSENPFFTIRITPTYAKQYFVHIPLWFTSQQRAFQGEKHVELEVGDKAWPVNLQCRRYVKFARGWKSFVEDNSLKTGDVCTFELIKELPSVSMKVTITRDV